MDILDFVVLRNTNAGHILYAYILVDATVAEGGLTHYS